MTTQKHSSLLWVFFLCLSQTPCWCSLGLSDDYWPVEPLFGDSWIHAGLAGMGFSTYRAPSDSAHCTEKRDDLPTLRRIKYQPSKKPNGRRFMNADSASMAYHDSFTLLEHGSWADLEIAQHNFLMCYKYSKILRWLSCLQLAKIFLKMNNKIEANFYLTRILNSTSSSVTIKSEAQKLLETHFTSP